MLARQSLAPARQQHDNAAGLHGFNRVRHGTAICVRHPEIGNHDVRMEGGTVLSHPDSLVVKMSESSRGLEIVLGFSRSDIIGSIKTGEMFSDDILGAELFYSFGAGIPRQHPASRIE